MTSNTMRIRNNAAVLLVVEITAFGARNRSTILYSLHEV